MFSHPTENLHQKTVPESIRHNWILYGRRSPLLLPRFDDLVLGSELPEEFQHPATDN